MDDAAEAFTSFTANPLSPLSAMFSLPASKSQADEVSNSNIDLREDELMEEDRGENEEADDSQEPLRRIRLVTLDNSQEQEEITEATKLRRSFEVIPLRRSRASYNR